MLTCLFQEEIREEQMVKRLMRQTQQEKRIVVQLTQIKRQKEILRQNRIFQERQNQERRLQDLQEALDREAVRTQTHQPQEIGFILLGQIQIKHTIKQTQDGLHNIIKESTNIYSHV